MYVEDADITRKAQEYGKVMYVPEAHVYHAWHRDTKKKWKNFWMQIRSMLRYWRKWGFRMVWGGGVFPGKHGEACIALRMQVYSREKRKAKEQEQ